MNWSRKAIIAVSMFLLGTAQPCHAEFFSTRSVRFMQGSWICKDGEEVTQEVWTSPQGDSMAGMCRMVKEEETTLYELMTMKEKDGGLYLNIKHFDGNLKPWSQDKEAGELKMVEGNHFSEAVFDNGKKENHVRITYKLQSYKLISVVEVTKDGETKKFQFDFGYDGRPSRLFPVRQNQAPVGDFLRHPNRAK